MNICGKSSVPVAAVLILTGVVGVVLLYVATKAELPPEVAAHRDLDLLYSEIIRHHERLNLDEIESLSVLLEEWKEDPLVVEAFREVGGNWHIYVNDELGSILPRSDEGDADPVVLVLVPNQRALERGAKPSAWQLLKSWKIEEKQMDQEDQRGFSRVDLDS